MDTWTTPLREPRDFGPAWGVSHLDVMDLLPIAILCVLSLVCITLWMLAVWKHIGSADRRRQ
jgi:hypothetical protein